MGKYPGGMRTISGYHRPATIDEALELLNRDGVSSVLIAGGSVVNASEFATDTEVVDLQEACSDNITEESGRVVIGPMVRLQQLVDDPATPGLLRDLALREGPNTLRNAATMGGTVASADPESELLAGLLVHEATVDIAKADGVETATVAEVLSNRQMLTGGVISTISVATGGATATARTGRTPADTSIVAAVGRSLDGGPLLALTGVASTPVLVTRDEVDSLNPPADFRGSSEYRRDLATTLSDRVFHQIGGSA